MKVTRYVNRYELIAEKCRGQDVLDIGVVLAPRDTVEARRAMFSRSLHMRIASVANHLVGIDLLEDEIAELRSLFPSLCLYSGNVESLSEVLPPHRYDVIVMGDIIEHLSNPGRALDQVRPFLAPEGKLYISCPNAFGLPNYLRFLTGRFHEGPDHVNAYTKYTMANLLARHELHCSALWTALDKIPPGTTRKVLYRLGSKVLSRFPDVGGTLIFEVQHANDAGG